MREGSVVQVTCDKGYSDGAYNGGPPTAKCVDKGKGGVYDPPMCSPTGLPMKGFDACTPAKCIAYCPQYPLVEHGLVTRKCNGPCASDPVYLAGEVAEIKCDEGFALSFDSVATATCSGETGQAI